MIARLLTYVLDGSTYDAVNLSSISAGLQATVLIEFSTNLSSANIARRTKSRVEAPNSERQPCSISLSGSAAAILVPDIWAEKILTKNFARRIVIASARNNPRRQTILTRRARSELPFAF